MLLLILALAVGIGITLFALRYTNDGGISFVHFSPHTKFLNSFFTNSETKGGGAPMNEDTEKLQQRVKELEEENERLSGVLKANGLLEEKNKDYPLHNVWFESGKYAGV